MELEIRLPLNEQERVYEFPPEFPGLPTTVITILQPRELALARAHEPLDKQLHMILDQAGEVHYVPPGWKHIAVILNKPTQLSNIIAENVIESGAGGAS